MYRRAAVIWGNQMLFKQVRQHSNCDRETYVIVAPKSPEFEFQNGLKILVIKVYGEIVVLQRIT